MKTKIITAFTHESLQSDVNDFLKFCTNVKDVNLTVGVGPNGPQFFALILFEDSKL
jgi:hypothetical protein